MNKDIFRFKRTRNKFRWESDFMALEFSDPSIQGFNSYIPLKGEKDIMYYYYIVRIYKKFETDDKDENEIIQWKLVSSRSTYDFPSILELKWILEEQLKDNTKIDGQKIVYRDGDIAYTKTMFTEGFACDDFYEIRKTIIEGKSEKYIVYVGTTYDCEGDLNSCGIRTPYVERKDIELLLKCVSEFIKYSIEKENEYIEKVKDSFEIKNKKIYEYKYDYKNKKENIKDIDNIYAIGDCLDITTVVDNKEIKYNNIELLNIKDNILVLKKGNIINNIDIKTVVYISNNPTDEMLKYNVDEVAKEFVSILEQEEIEEFKNKNINYLLKKYKESIIGRTWLCREEHNFNMDYTLGDRVNIVTPIVKDIIKIIKDKLNKL